MGIYVNPTEGKLPVYADSGMTQKIGTLFKGSTCQCVGEQDGLAIILYRITTSLPVVSKVGFADAAGIRGYVQ